ncbi:conserved hypothetical protein [Gammaproteobacteria bacterium]
MLNFLFNGSRPFFANQHETWSEKWKWVFWITLFFLFQWPAVAENLNLQGFGTIGLARSTTDKAEFVRDLSQPDGISDEWSPKIDSLLGIQVSFQATPLIDAVTQIVSRHHSDGTHHPELMWGFIRYDPNANLNFRLGRLGSEFYMLSDSRLVGYSYVTVRPSNDYFGGLPFSYVDGVDALITLPLGNGLARGKMMSGWTREEVPSGDFQFNLDKSLLLGGYLDYQTGSWQWRVGYSQLRFHNEIPALPLLEALKNTGLPSAQTAAENFSVVGKLVKYYSFGVVYDQGAFNTQIMLSRTSYQSAFFENSSAGYLLGSYRIGLFIPFMGLSWTKSAPKLAVTGLPSIYPLTLIDNALATGMRDSHSDQKTFTVGTRWDFHHNMALKAQWDVIHGKPDSIFPYRWEVPGWSGRMNVFSFTLDFIF